MGLALYIGLAGLPLGVQGVELQVQVMFGGFAGVDGAAGQLSGLRPRSAALWPRGLPCLPQTKEPGAVPVGPGDDPGDGGQAGIVPPSPPKPLRR